MRSALVIVIGFVACASGSANARATAQAPNAQAARTASPAAFDNARHQAEQAREAGRAAEAIDWYQKAVALDPTWTEGFWYLGTMYYEADRHRECRDAFARVVRTQPDHAAAWAFRGLCEYRLAAYAVALQHLTRADDLGLGSQRDLQAIVAYHRALLLTRSGQFERALDIEIGLLRGGNTGPEIQQAMGATLLRLPLLPQDVPADTRRLVELAGRAGAAGIALTREEAEPAFRELVTAYPAEPNVHYLYATYLARDRPDEALAEFKRELERSPDHVLARVQIAQELLKRNDVDGAAPYAREAVRLGPKNFLARKVLGQIELQTGHVERAIAELETARTLEPTSPTVRFQLARAYQRAGRAEDAARERTEFKRLETIQQQRRGGAAALEGDSPQ
jgi:tetratricopeptide (TPR) repeat protein